MRRLSRPWRMCSRFIRARMIRRDHSSVLMRHPSNSSPRRARRSRCGRGSRRATTTSTSATVPQTCSCCLRPLEGWRHVKVTERRTAVDYAHVLKDVSDTHFKDAEKIVLVQDNLNTHSPASLYEAFPPAEARRLVERFEWHYTPKHGSWLDMAESELAVLCAQCLNRRIANPQTLKQEVAAWLSRRNTKYATADWRFTTAAARIKLKRVYPIYPAV